MNDRIRKLLTSRYFYIPVAVVLLYTLAGFVAAPKILRWYVPKYAAQHLDCRAAVEHIRINPFLLSIEADQFSLQQADGSPMLAFARLFVDLEVSSLFHWAVVLREAAVDQPDIQVVTEPDGSLNLARLAATSPPVAETAKDDTGPLPFILRNATIRGGRLAVVDKRQSTPAGLTLQGLDLDLREFSTLKDRNGTCRLAAATKDGESVQWQGEISLSPLRSKGRLTLNVIQAASLWQFFRDRVNLEQPVGRINVTGDYRLNAENSTLQLILEGLHVSSADLALKLPKTDRAFFQAKKLDLEAPLFDLATGELHVARLLLADGAVDVRLDDGGGLNLQQVVRPSLPEKSPGKKTPAPAVPPPSATAEPPFKIRIDAVDVNNIAVDLDDRSRKTPIRATIAGVDLHLQAELAAGADTGGIVLRDITSALRNIRIQRDRAAAPLFAAETLSAEGGECDLGARSISLERLALAGGGIDIGRDAAGGIDWQQLLQPNETVAKKKGAKPEPRPGRGWKYLVKAFEVEGFRAAFTDLTTSSAAPVLNLQEFNGRLTGIDGRSPMGFTADIQLARGGTATVRGTVDPSVPSVDAELEAAGVVLTSLQPYLDPYVTLTLESASASARGRLRYGIPGDAGKAAYEGEFSLNAIRLTDPGSQKPYLSVDAVQFPAVKLTMQPDGVEAKEIRITKPVGEVIIGEDQTLNLARVIKKRPGGGPPPSASRPAAGNDPGRKKQDTFVYQIERLRIDKGDMVFADLSLQPQFRTRIHDLKGSITGLSSAADAPARVRLGGSVDRYGIARIGGVIRTDDFRRASDLNLVFRNVEMKSLSPYSGKFAGRLITSGKVSADLKYKLQDYRMTGDNQIVIDNLVLGERVDNPAAANLPLDLALALLKDSSGRIDIGLPVSGDLNDPRFSFGSLIGRMFTNLITKTATAPFQVLGKLLGGKAERFDALAFAPGSARLLPPEEEKLQKLADALKSRPQLKVVIQGRFSPEADGLVLKKLGVRRIVATRLGEKLNPEDRPGPLDFTASDTRDVLEQLYAERFGKQSLDELEKGIASGTVEPQSVPADEAAKSREAGTLAKMTDSLKLYALVPGGKSREQAVIWAGELYSRLVESEKVADGGLLRLAEDRAQSAAASLEGEGGIPRDRIAIKAAEPLAGKAGSAVTLALDAL